MALRLEMVETSKLWNCNRHGLSLTFLHRPCRSLVLQSNVVEILLTFVSIYE